MEFEAFQLLYWLHYKLSNLYSASTVSARFDVEKFPNKIYLNCCGDTNDENLNYRPCSNVAIIVLDQCIIAWFSSSWMSLILEHHIQIWFNRLNYLGKIIHVNIQVFNLLGEFFPVIIFDNCDIKIDHFSGKSWELVVNAYWIIATRWLPICIIRICLPFIRHYHLSTRVTNSKSSHTIASSNHLKRRYEKQSVNFFYFQWYFHLSKTNMNYVDKKKLYKHATDGFLMNFTCIDT